ncbi:MAG: aspartate kinase [Candidatus Stahlbacteria bacterium]|nr:aspartate kinase [Candidatus Stahlbacteria bacterium]
MKKIAVKFGGSILKSKEDISKLIWVVKSYDTSIVIVVSALYGITDILAKSIRKIKEDESEINSLMKTLIEAHIAIIRQYINDSDTRQKIIRKIRKRGRELWKYLLGIHYIGTIPHFAECMVLSYGERLSSLLLESILRYMDINCKEALPEEIGLITDGEFRNASVDFSVSEERVKKSLSDSKIYIVPGFYGMSPDSMVTLFGKGGSDYSVAAIARCIDASSVDIWKDVSGFMSADPKVVDNPIPIQRLTYTEAAELSYFGARILHPRTVEPLMDKKIPIRIFNINDFSGEFHPSTIIEDKGFLKEDVIKSVTFSDDIGILRLIGPGVGIKPGIMAKVTNCLNDVSINIKSIITAQTCINILLAREDLKQSYNIVNKFALSSIDKIEYQDRISLIAVVGEGILEKYGIAARVLSAVSQRGINVQLISAGASKIAAYFIVDAKDKEEAVKAIHKEFFN